MGFQLALSRLRPRGFHFRQPYGDELLEADLALAATEHLNPPDEHTSTPHASSSRTVNMIIPVRCFSCGKVSRILT
jgi:hypothetical protein